MPEGQLPVRLTRAASKNLRQRRNSHTPHINIHPHSGWHSSFGHSPNNTGCAQVLFLLVCPPCNCYLLSVNGCFWGLVVTCRDRRPRLSILRYRVSLCNCVNFSSHASHVVKILHQPFSVLFLCFLGQSGTPVPTSSLFYFFLNPLFFFFSSAKLYSTPPLWRGFRYTIKTAENVYVLCHSVIS